MGALKTYLKHLYSDYLYYHYKRLYEKDPRLAAKALYKKIYGSDKSFNIDEPKTLIEKITWLELNTDTSLWTLCADKYRMREYVKQCGLADSLPKNYGHWENPDDIDFSQLPDEFVLKANNGCGTVMVIRDKGTIKERKIKKELKRWLKHKFGYWGAQKHYLSIQPCIISEELLHQDDEQNKISPNSMVDYKVWCINGEPVSILVVYNRHKVSHINIAMFDTQWNPLPQYLKPNEKDVYNPRIQIAKPKCLDDMLGMACKLAAPFPQVRVDFYIANGKPVIGELTFSTGYGYFTDEYYLHLGNKITLPQR